MHHSQSRLEAISDGIFAFAATLVVVSLDVPDTFAELKTNLLGFGSFAVSFGALILIWRCHYLFFRRTETVDNWIMLYNFCMLFVVLFYVYPLKFLANLTFQQARVESFQELSELLQLYGWGFAAIFFFLMMMYRHAAKKEGDAAQVHNYYARFFAFFVLAGVLFAIIAYSQIGLRYGASSLAFVLLGILCTWHGRKYGELLAQIPASRDRR